MVIMIDADAAAVPAGLSWFDECEPASDVSCWLADGEFVPVTEVVPTTRTSAVAAIRAELSALAVVDDHGAAAVAAGELSDLIVSCQRVMSQARALQATLAEELASRSELAPASSAAEFRSVSAESCAALEVTAPLALTSGQAEYLVNESVRLVRDFPATLAALARGDLDERRVRVILAELGRQDREVAAAVEAAVIGRASEQNTTQLRRSVKRLLHRLAPEQAEERRARAAADRHVRVWPAEDGMAWIEALMRAEDAAAIEAVLDSGEKALKRRDADTGDARARTRDQRRADVLAKLAWAALTEGRIGPTGDGSVQSPVRDVAGALSLSGAHGRPVAVQVTVSLTTLAGLDEEPGDLDGYGHVPARVARELAAAGIWTWVGCDPVTGAVVDHGRTRYTPTRDLVDHVLLRDRTCRAPGCAVPAVRCDLDHVHAYGAGGLTCPANLTPLCRKHHLIKHHGPFAVDRPEPGTLRWTSPTGRTTSRGPDRPGPVHDPPPGTDDPPF
ncbi:HNH endonuclease signature motif containing protein [Jiangella anatolica]|nr:HNH endonuclease signature motif containing protein [Jiangella anatolica]